jgi:hypothetical protein
VHYRVPLWFICIVLFIGATLSTLGVVELQRELELSATGVRAEGTVVSFAVPRWSYKGASVDFEIAQPQATSRRVHVDHASVIRDWDQGMPLVLVCAQRSDQVETCEVDGLLDRWFEPALLLMLGLPVVVWGGSTALERWPWH